MYVQVLCDANTKWKAMTSDGEIPSNAIPAGISGSQTQYAGRICDDDKRVTIGQVKKLSYK